MQSESKPFTEATTEGLRPTEGHVRTGGTAGLTGRDAGGCPVTWKPGVWDEGKPPTAPALRLRVYVNGIPYLVEVEPVWEPPSGTAVPAQAAWSTLMPGELAPWLSTRGGPGAPLAPLRGAVPERPVSSSAATLQHGDAWREMA